MSIHIRESTDPTAWDSFLAAQPYRPFLQSWTMGEVYRAIKQEPVRLEAVENGEIVGIAFGHIVPARRGKHLSIPYGPIASKPAALKPLIDELKRVATEHGCSFIRMSPFLPAVAEAKAGWPPSDCRPSPLHLLAEHLWYLPLKNPDPWVSPSPVERGPGGEVVADELFKSFRATHRNLIRRAQKEGVTVEPSTHPNQDIEHFLTLHEETRKRHGFTPYSDTFFRAQLELFAARGEATLYQAHYQCQVIASSIHMHIAGETSYHHGASTHAFAKIPSSYLLQWTAIQDAITRGDHVYNFWGIAPLKEGDGTPQFGKKHPFAGVTLFKTGFSGKLLELTHCIDVPLKPSYHLTRGFEYLRKWKRGF